MLKNPSYYQAGFWMTYTMEGRTQMGRSTEPGKYTPTQIRSEDHSLIVNYEHRPDKKKSALKNTIRLWSWERPFLLIRYDVVNVGKAPIEDLKVYYLIDFDLGGPISYNNDYGEFDVDSGSFNLWDNSPVFVRIASQPQVDAWDIAGPIRLRPSKFRRDLKNRSEMGPADIATAQQWNLGTLQSENQRSIDIAIAAGRTNEEASSALAQALEMFAKRSR